MRIHRRDCQGGDREEQAQETSGETRRKNIDCWIDKQKEGSTSMHGQNEHP